MILVTKFEDGDIPVELWQREGRGERFKVVYGLHVEDNLTYGDASKEFGECVFHSLACAGKLDNEGD